MRTFRAAPSRRDFLMATGKVICPRVVTVMSRVMSCFMLLILPTGEVRGKAALRAMNNE